MSAKAFRCLIVDDEPQAHEVLKAHMALIPSLEWCGSCFNALEAIRDLREKHIDLLFLDIQMPRLLGTDLIKSLQVPPKTILVTAHREFAMDGFELGVTDYLLKPVAFDRFVKAINKAIPAAGPERIPAQETSEKYLYLRVNRQMVKVWLHDILYVESLKDYVKLVTRQGTLITKLSLMGLLDMLPDGDFLQVHRSFLIAIRHVDAYAADSLKIGKSEVPVGPLYRNLLRNRMQELRWS